MMSEIVISCAFPQHSLLKLALSVLADQRPAHVLIKKSILLRAEKLDSLFFNCSTSPNDFEANSRTLSTVRKCI